MKAPQRSTTFGTQHLGLAVTVSGYACTGRLRFVGAHAVHRTPRVGIELEHQIGKNDGTVVRHLSPDIILFTTFPFIRAVISLQMCVLSCK